MLKKLALWAAPLCFVALNSGCYLLDGGHACPGYGSPCGYAGNCVDNVVGDCVDDCAGGPRCDDSCGAYGHQAGPLDLIIGLLNCHSYPGCGCGESYCGEGRGEPWGCGPCDSDGNYVGRGGCSNCGGGHSYGTAPYAPGAVHESDVYYEGRTRPTATRTTRVPTNAAPARTTRAPVQQPAPRTTYVAPNTTAKRMTRAPSEAMANRVTRAPSEPMARQVTRAPSEATAARYVGTPRIISETDEVVKPARVDPQVPVTATSIELAEPAPATGKWTAARSRSITN